MSAHLETHRICMKDDGWFCLECPARNEPGAEAARTERDAALARVAALEEGLRAYAELSRFEWKDWGPKLAKMERTTRALLATAEKEGT